MKIQRERILAKYPDYEFKRGTFWVSEYVLCLKEVIHKHVKWASLSALERAVFYYIKELFNKSEAFKKVYQDKNIKDIKDDLYFYQPSNKFIHLDEKQIKAKQKTDNKLKEKLMPEGVLEAEEDLEDIFG